ncbi:hypothetical protein ACFSSF_17430 [Dietzia aerolata]|uniref:hypothetical protein n=1 Tax=Dietzia aerolata TaxID=595984 RepID=UPI003636BC56
MPADVFAEIRLPTALGSPFIALTPPRGERSAELLQDARVVPLARTGVGPDLESSLASLGLLLNGSGIDQLGTVMEELTVALDGRGDEIARIRERGTVRSNCTSSTAATSTARSSRWTRSTPHWRPAAS